MTISKKTQAWLIAIIVCTGMLLISITPGWLGALIIGLICGLVFEPWKRR